MSICLTSDRNGWLGAENGLLIVSRRGKGGEERRGKEGGVLEERILKPMFYK
jgi:hypothetical protein